MEEGGQCSAPAVRSCSSPVIWRFTKKDATKRRRMRRALSRGLRRRRAPVAIVGYSGLLVLPAQGPEAVAAEISARPPVLLVHGDQDDLIPAQALFLAAEGLVSLGMPAEWHLSHGIGHGIDPEGLRHGGEFLAQRLGLRARAESAILR